MGGWGVSRARRVRCGADLLPFRLLPFVCCRFVCFRHPVRLHPPQAHTGTQALLRGFRL
jgi:hypothetical protein